MLQGNYSIIPKEIYENGFEKHRNLIWTVIVPPGVLEKLHAEKMKSSGFEYSSPATYGVYDTLFVGRALGGN